MKKKIMILSFIKSSFR